MKVSIGVLAWNEESSIEQTLRSILAQSLVTARGEAEGHSVEILCLPNGCTDDTAGVAARVFADAGLASRPGVEGRVHAIEMPSKANAWNVFVHEASRPDADCLILMDGDVRIDTEDTLRNMVAALEAHPEAAVAGARTVKHLAKETSWNPLHRISLGASSIRQDMPGTFAGCLYCARAEALRAFRLPSVLIGEDVFVRAMIVTDYFTHPGRTDRVVTAPDARVLFEAYTAPRQVFKNLKRRATTLAIDAILFTRLWAEASPSAHGGELTKRWHAEDPRWAETLLAREIPRQSRRTNPTYHIRKWIARLDHMPLLRAVVLLPAAIAGGLLDTAAEHAAFQAMRRGEVGQGWFGTKTELG